MILKKLNFTLICKFLTVVALNFSLANYSQADEVTVEPIEQNDEIEQKIVIHNITFVDPETAGKHER